MKQVWQIIGFGSALALTFLLDFIVNKLTGYIESHKVIIILVLIFFISVNIYLMLYINNKIVWAVLFGTYMGLCRHVVYFIKGKKR